MFPFQFILSIPSSPCWVFVKQSCFSYLITVNCLPGLLSSQILPLTQTQITKRCRDKTTASPLSLVLQHRPGWLSPDWAQATAFLLPEDTLQGKISGCLQRLESHCGIWESASVDFGLALSWPSHTRCRYWCTWTSATLQSGSSKSVSRVTQGLRP